MVQTEQQYICIHQCLLVVLEGKEGTEREIHDNPGYEGKILSFCGDTSRPFSLYITWWLIYFLFSNNGLIYALIIDSFVTRKVPPDLRQPSSLV